MIEVLAIIGAGDLGQLIAYHAKNDGHARSVIFYDDLILMGTITENGIIKGKTDKVTKAIFQEAINAKIRPMIKVKIASNCLAITSPKAL